MGHHVYTNIEGVDPDIVTSPNVSAPVKPVRHVIHWGVTGESWFGRGNCRSGEAESLLERGVGVCKSSGGYGGVLCSLSAGHSEDKVGAEMAASLFLPARLHAHALLCRECVAGGGEERCRIYRILPLSLSWV